MKLTVKEIRTLQLALINIESGLTESGIAKVKSLSEKLEGEVQRLTKRALDVCPVSVGKGFVKNTHGVEQYYVPCDGTGQRQ